MKHYVILFEPMTAMPPLASVAAAVATDAARNSTPRSDGAQMPYARRFAIDCLIRAHSAARAGKSQRDSDIRAQARAPLRWCTICRAS